MFFFRPGVFNVFSNLHCSSGFLPGAMLSLSEKGSSVLVGLLGAFHIAALHLRMALVSSELM